MSRIALPVLLAILGLGACGGSDAGSSQSSTVTSLGRCAPGAAPLEIRGGAAFTDAKTYRQIPFTVAPGTGRIELSYEWQERGGLPPTPLTATTLDLGLWDTHGYRSAQGFRGWSGSRQGRIDQKQGPIFVQQEVAERGYLPGPIEPGTWFADLGIAAVSPLGADWLVKIECKEASGSTPADDPVDTTHVARSGPGWFHGDFHMHAFHSNPNAPDWDDFIAQARDAELDFLMVTEYVTGQHWRTLGVVQRAHPDLVIWPGREVITYYGHVTGHGETPNVLEYRHGFEDVTIGEIQRLIKADGALFQVNHPTIFPPPLFTNFCRGCYFELDGRIDWDQVDTIEVQTGPAIASGDDLGVPLPLEVENPFTTTALELWDRKLRAGHRITAVSGSDSKGVDAPQDRARKGYGSSATAVYAENLSRAALADAIRAGRAYVRGRGVNASPSLELEATAPGGQHGTFGDTLMLGPLEAATLKTTVVGGTGQLLIYLQNGLPLVVVPILADPFVHVFPLALRNPLTEGPLGTYWRVETRDLRSRTTIGNPIFFR